MPPRAIAIATGRQPAFSVAGGTMTTDVLDSDAVQKLARIVEESTRSTREGVKFFIEPAPGTLARAKNKRHHVIFGRRGSGKSSLLAKVTEDLTIGRTPIAYVDLAGC
jgi:polynucleotide 5'-kinase involved in rRNA processing